MKDTELFIIIMGLVGVRIVPYKLSVEGMHLENENGFLHGNSSSFPDCILLKGTRSLMSDEFWRQSLLARLEFESIILVFLIWNLFDGLSAGSHYQGNISSKFTAPY